MKKSALGKSVSTMGVSRQSALQVQEGVPTLFLGNLHFGEAGYSSGGCVSDSEACEIAELRLETVFSSFLDYTRREPGFQQFTDCVVAVSGISIAGERPAENAARLAAFLFEQCKRLEALFASVVVIGTVGNRGHGLSCFSMLESLCVDYETTISVWYSPNTDRQWWSLYDTPYVMVHSDPMPAGATEDLQGAEDVRAAGLAFRKAMLQQVLDEHPDELSNANGTVLLAGHFSCSVDAHKAGFMAAGALRDVDAHAMRDTPCTPERPSALAWVTRPNRGITSVLELWADDNEREATPADDHMTPVRAIQWKSSSMAQQYATRQAA